MTKIAVIDDDETVRTSIVNLLQKVGYEVVDYTDAAFALADKCLKDVDVILTDLAMPTRGEVLIQTVRSREMEIPIIVLSGYIEEKTPVTVSVGLATCSNGSIDASALLKEADVALYRAKNLGRNRVECSLIVDRSLGVINVNDADDLYVQKGEGS